MLQEFLDIAKVGDEEELPGILNNLCDDPLSLVVVEMRKDRSAAKAKAYYLGIELGNVEFKKRHGDWSVSHDQ